MRWLITDDFAHLPEVQNCVPIGVAFAQFLAVECDLDPFERQQLAEDLQVATPAQEVMRKHQRWLQSGELRSFSRPLGGGAPQAIPAGHWHADDVRDRFLHSRYSRREPFNPEAEPDSWIFLDEADLKRIWDELREQLLGMSVRSRGSSRKVQRKVEVRVDTLDTEQKLLLDLKDLELLLGVSKSTIYKYVTEGTFPAQVKVGVRSLWRRQDIHGWLQSRK